MVSGVGGGVFMLSAVICLGKEMIRIGMTGIHPGDVVHFRATDWHPSVLSPDSKSDRPGTLTSTWLGLSSSSVRRV